jgi:hypothetical protein
VVQPDTKGARSGYDEGRCGVGNEKRKWGGTLRDSEAAGAPRHKLGEWHSRPDAVTGLFRSLFVVPPCESECTSGVGRLPECGVAVRWSDIGHSGPDDGLSPGDGVKPFAPIQPGCDRTVLAGVGGLLPRDGRLLARE